MVVEKKLVSSAFQKHLLSGFLIQEHLASISLPVCRRKQTMLSLVICLTAVRTSFSRMWWPGHLHRKRGTAIDTRGHLESLCRQLEVLLSQTY